MKRHHLVFIQVKNFDLGEDALAQLADKVAQGAGRHLPLVVAKG